MNLIFLVSSLKRANYSERLIRRRRISGTNLSRVPRLEDNGVWHFSTLLSVDHLCGLRQELGRGRSFFESSDRNPRAPVKTQTFGRLSWATAPTRIEELLADKPGRFLFGVFPGIGCSSNGRQSRTTRKISAGRRTFWNGESSWRTVLPRRPTWST